MKRIPVRKLPVIFLSSMLALCGNVAKADPSAFVVYDFRNNRVLDGVNLTTVRPMASITKLMTAHVFMKMSLAAGNRSECTSVIPEHDPSISTSTRLPRETPIPCSQLFYAMLVSSDNHAAHALARAIPGLTQADFVNEMNRQARLWGMHNTHYADPSGISSANVSTVSDLAILSKRLMSDNISRAVVRKVTATAGITLNVHNNSGFMKVGFNNTNRLIREGRQVLLSKTGTTRAAGYNLLHVQPCGDGRIIGVISMNNANANERIEFTRRKLYQNMCF